MEFKHRLPNLKRRDKAMASNSNKSTHNKVLKDVRTPSNGYNHQVIIDIPLNLIDANPDNNAIFGMRDMERFAEHIKDVGFKGVIEVYKKSDGRYEISLGHRRFEALKMLNSATIPCLVSEMPDNITRAKELIDSNIYNREMSPLIKASAIAYYRQVLSMEMNLKGAQDPSKKCEKDSCMKLVPISMVAEHFGMSNAQATRYLALLDMIPELQEIADTPGVSVSALESAKKLSEIQQKEIVKNIRGILDKGGHVSRPEIIRMIKNIRKKGEKDDFVSAISDGAINDSENIFVDFENIILKDVHSECGDSDSPQGEIIDTPLSTYCESIQKLVSHGGKIKDTAKIEKCIMELENAIGELKMLLKPLL